MPVSVAFTVTAETADGASSFMFYNATAVRAGSLEERDLFANGTKSVCGHMGLNGLGNGICAGKYLVFAESGREVDLTPWNWSTFQGRLRFKIRVDPKLFKKHVRQIAGQLIRSQT
jgi:hypothetical protein